MSGFPRDEVDMVLLAKTMRMHGIVEAFGVRLDPDASFEQVGETRLIERDRARLTARDLKERLEK